MLYVVKKHIYKFNSIKNTVVSPYPFLKQFKFDFINHNEGINLGTYCENLVLRKCIIVLGGLRLNMPCILFMLQRKRFYINVHVGTHFN